MQNVCSFKKEPLNDFVCTNACNSKLTDSEEMYFNKNGQEQTRGLKYPDLCMGWAPKWLDLHSLYLSCYLVNAQFVTSGLISQTWESSSRATKDITQYNWWSSPLNSQIFVQFRYRHSNDLTHAYTHFEHSNWNVLVYSVNPRRLCRSETERRRKKTSVVSEPGV